MKIVHYHNTHLRISPVKQFLEKYTISSSDTVKQRAHKLKVIAFMDETIHLVANNNGRPIPPSAQPLRGYPFHEMRIKDSSNLIRILYFSYQQGVLVLLHAFEKPDYYEKAKKKKVERVITIALEQAYNNYKDFLTYKYYEPYQIQVTP